MSNKQLVNNVHLHDSLQLCCQQTLYIKKEGVKTQPQKYKLSDTRVFKPLPHRTY